MDTKNSKYITVFVTIPEDRAADLAAPLVNERLAACVNILPTVRSIYLWQGEVCDDPEALLVIKTRAELFSRLRLRVVELHPYDVPEVIALPVVDGHQPYLSWLDESTRS